MVRRFYHQPSSLHGSLAIMLHPSQRGCDIGRSTTIWTFATFVLGCLSLSVEPYCSRSVYKAACEARQQYTKKTARYRLTKAARKAGGRQDRAALTGIARRSQSEATHASGCVTN